MKYSQYLKDLFKGISLNVEDLFLLEIFQLKYLPERLPQKEFAALLRLHPVIHRYLVSKYPPIEDFISKIFRENRPIDDRKTSDECCQEALWEIGELIIYNKYPEVYDSTVKLDWDISQITSITSLEGKTIIDAGAGTGRLSFLVAPYVKTVFAVEPVTSFRQFIREKVARENIKNIYATDGLLDTLPYPDHSVDILITSNAFGWTPEDELREIERVVKPGGCAIHFFRNFDPKEENPFHAFLSSPEWGYSCKKFIDNKGANWKYYKIMK